MNKGKEEELMRLMGRVKEKLEDKENPKYNSEIVTNLFERLEINKDNLEGTNLYKINTAIAFYIPPAAKKKTSYYNSRSGRNIVVERAGRRRPEDRRFVSARDRFGDRIANPAFEDPNVDPRNDDGDGTMNFEEQDFDIQIPTIQHLDNNVGVVESIDITRRDRIISEISTIDADISYFTRLTQNPLADAAVVIIYEREIAALNVRREVLTIELENISLEEQFNRVHMVTNTGLNHAIDNQGNFIREADTYSRYIDTTFYGAFKGEVVEKKKLTSIEIKKQKYNGFIAHYGGNPAFIKGYIVNDKVYTNNKDLLSDISVGLNLNTNDIRVILKVYILDATSNKETFKIMASKSTNFQRISKQSTLLEVIPFLLKIKLRDYKLSGEIFGNVKYKKELFEKSEGFISNWSIESSKIKKLTSPTLYINVIEDDGDKETKFLFSDCEFYNPELSGYIPPKESTIRVGDTVKIKNNRLENYNKNPVSRLPGIVDKIKTNPSSKRISKSSSNRRLDLVSVIFEGKVLTVYAGDLVLIERNKKVDKYEPKQNNQKKVPGIRWTSLVEEF